jgi:hypothetical protein
MKNTIQLFAKNAGLLPKPISKAEKRRLIILETMTCLLVLLWLYTGLDKLVDYKSYWHSMCLQIFPRSVLKIIVPVVPIVELGIGLLFFRPKWRGYAYVSSLLLLVSFTIYVALIYFGYFPKRPCACAGLFEKMSWGAAPYCQYLSVHYSILGTDASPEKKGGVGQSINQIINQRPAADRWQP